MGAWVDALIGCIIAFSLVGPWIPAAAADFHEPLPHSMLLASGKPGWLGARLDPAGTQIEVSAYATSSGPKLFQVFFYDEQDEGVASAQVFAEPRAASLRAGVYGVSLEANQMLPFLGGGGSMWGIAGSACGGVLGMWISTSGEYGMSLRIPVTCDGRSVKGFLVSALDEATQEARYSLASDAPVAPPNALAGGNGEFVDASEFTGLSTELRLVTPTGTVETGRAEGARYETAVGRALFGGFVDTAPSGTTEADISWAHGNESGPCRCYWQGDTWTRGDWRFGLEGDRATRVYLAFIDAGLPPR